MSLRLDPTEPASMTAEARLDETASIFARGVVRLHSRTLPPVQADPDGADAPEASLDLSAPPCPCVVAG